MQTYLTNLAELFKLAAAYQDQFMTAHAARLLELSLQPKAALAYWQQYCAYFRTVAEPRLLQEIEEYLIDKTRLFSGFRFNAETLSSSRVNQPAYAQLPTCRFFSVRQS